MAAKNKEIVLGARWTAGFMTNFLAAAERAGVGFEELHRLGMDKEKGAALLAKLMQEVIAARPSRQQKAAPVAVAPAEICETCETSVSVFIDVNYDLSFEGRDAKLKLTYHNSSVVDANFKASDVLRSFEHGMAQREFKVYRPKRRISSEAVIALMKKDGFRPATARELLAYYVDQLLAQKFERWFLFVTLGTVWLGCVVYLRLDPANRSLDLDTFDSDWYTDHEFLAVRESE